MDKFFKDRDSQTKKIIEYIKQAQALKAKSEETFKQRIIKGIAHDEEGALGGYYGFKNSLEFYNLMKSDECWQEDNELWVACILDRPVTSAEDIVHESIKMAVTVMTNRNGPMTTHMGITRGIDFLLRAAKGEAQLSRGLSIPLHSFAALFMKHRYPHMLYMITKPVNAMTGILRKSLELDHEIFIGTNIEYAKSLVALKRVIDTNLGETPIVESEALGTILPLITFDQYPSPIFLSFNQNGSTVFRLYNPEKSSILLEAKYKESPFSGNLILESAKTPPSNKNQLYSFLWFFEHRNMGDSNTPYAICTLDSLAYRFHS